VVQRQADLLQIVFALTAARGLARLLNRRQDQRDENANDGNDHQQFDERKTSFAARHVRPPLRRMDKHTGSLWREDINQSLPEHDDKMTVLSSSAVLREAQADARPSARLALDLDRAAMHFGDALDDRQAQADAAAGWRARPIGTIKALEDVWQVVGRDALPG